MSVGGRCLRSVSWVLSKQVLSLIIASAVPFRCMTDPMTGEGSSRGVSVSIPMPSRSSVAQCIKALTTCIKACQILLDFPSLACHDEHVGTMDPHMSQCDNGGMTTLCAIDKSNDGLRIRVRLAITSGGRMERAKAPSRPCGRCRRHPSSAFNLLSHLSSRPPSYPPKFCRHTANIISCPSRLHSTCTGRRSSRRQYFKES